LVHLNSAAGLKLRKPNEDKTKPSKTLVEKKSRSLLRVLFHQNQSSPPVKTKRTLGCYSTLQMNHGRLQISQKNLSWTLQI